MSLKRRSYEAGHRPKFLVIIDDSAECDRAVYYASRRAARIGAEMKRLVQDPAYIDSVLADGADRAHAIASETINAVKDIVGFIRH